jgi:hypothetical protein
MRKPFSVIFLNKIIAKFAFIKLNFKINSFISYFGGIKCLKPDLALRWRRLERGQVYEYVKHIQTLTILKWWLNNKSKYSLSSHLPSPPPALG